MRILISHLGTRGGGPLLQVEIARAMKASGVEVALAFDVSSESAENLSQLELPALRLGKMASRLKSRYRLAMRVLDQPIDTLRILILCRRTSVDVVFEPMSHPLQILPRMTLRLFGVRVLTSVHDAVRHAGEENAFMAWLSKNDLSNTDGVVVYSDAVRRSIGPTRAPIFQTVHGAFGPRVSKPRELGAGPYILGFFGRIERYKGIERFVDAVAWLQQAGCDVRGIVVGRGQIDSELTARMGSVNVSVENRWIADDEIPGVVQGFDVLVLPYDEASQSGVVGFALNGGIPIVATPVGGLAEQVLEGGGVLASDMDAVSFARAIEVLIRDRRWYRSVSKAQLEAAGTIYGWDRVARDLLTAAEAVTVRPSKDLKRPCV